MIGLKKWSEIRDELRQALNAKSAANQGPKKKRRVSKVERELEWICDALREALKEKKEVERRSKRTNGKKKPAV